MIGLPAWIVVGSLAVLGKTVYQSWQKSLNKEFESLYLAQIAFAVASVSFAGVVLYLSPELPNSTELILSVTAGLLVGSGLWMFNKSMETTDLSIASPLQQTIPVFAAVIEPLVLSNFGINPNVIAAAVLTTIGAYVVNIEKGNILRPLTRLTDRGPALALTTALLFGLASVISHLTTQSLAVPYYLLIETTSAFVLLTAVRGSLPDADIKPLGYGAVYSLNLGASILTLSLVVASKATVFFRLSLVMNVIIGLVVYDEQSLIMRLLGSLIIIAGVIVTVL